MLKVMIFTVIMMVLMFMIRVIMITLMAAMIPSTDSSLQNFPLMTVLNLRQRASIRHLNNTSE